MRGEYRTSHRTHGHDPELPPRARRIHTVPFVHLPYIGTTSACAENTPADRKAHPYRGNYLRVRGEYATDRINYSPAAELPPRARRIPTAFGPLSSAFGTTSACAENTVHDHVKQHIDWNYLRVRGEYCGYPQIKAACRELPPRARRIHFPLDAHLIIKGTTSACAENTQ